MTSDLVKPSASQQATVDLIVNNIKNGFNFNILEGETGSGKTLVSLAVACQLESKKVLYITQKSLIKEFNQDKYHYKHSNIEFLSIAMFTHEKRSTKSIEKAAYKLSAQYKDCDLIIADEADNFKNPKSKWGRVFTAFLAEMDKPTLCMSGTFKTNNNFDLFNFLALYKVLNSPDIQNSYFNIQFCIAKLIAEYIEEKQVKMGKKTIPQYKDKNSEKLKEVWNKVSYKLYKYQETLINKQGKIETFQVHPKVKDILKELNSDKVFWYDNSRVIRKTQFNRSEFSDGFAKLEDIYTEELETKRFNPNPKLDLLKQVLPTIDGQVIILAKFRESVDIIQDGLGCPVFNADDPNKGEELHRFRSGEYKAIVSTVQAISTGFDIDEANTIVYYSFPTLYRDLIQSFARIDRACSTQNKNYIFLMSDIEKTQALKTLDKVNQNAKEFGFKIDFLDNLS